jgi:hypothetical protein
MRIEHCVQRGRSNLLHNHWQRRDLPLGQSKEAGHMEKRRRLGLRQWRFFSATAALLARHLRRSCSWIQWMFGKRI